MARKDAKREDTETIAVALQIGKELEKFTAEPFEPARYRNSETGEDVRQFRSLLGSLVMTIIHIPRKVKTQEERFARAEAENLRAACELVELACDQVSPDAPETLFEVRKAITQLDAALVRFSIMAS